MHEGYIVRFLDGSDKKFIVPVYQIPYSWKKSDCELLLLKKLLVEHRITAEELLALMTKDFCRTHFYRVTYPALALSIDDNRGRSSKIRYYRDPVIVDNVSYFISSQWFDDSRDDLIEWYKEHVK